jgi:hypothetical protein
VKGREGWRPLRAWLAGVVLVLFLAGCQGLYYERPLAPSPPPPPAPVAPAPPSRPVFYVNVPRLNLRACPGMDCPRISVLELNEGVERLGEAEDWSQVRVTRDGRLGWVASRYLSAEPVAPPEVPVARPPLPEVPPPPKPPAVEAPPPPPKPPVAEKPKPTKPPEAAPRPAKPAKPAEAAEPPRKPTPPAAKPAEKPAEKPAPAEKPEPPAPEPTKRIRIM